MIVHLPFVPHACSCSSREIDEVWTSMNPSLEARLGEAAVELADEFRGIYGPETIRRFAVETVGLFRNSRITEFVPLLAYRYTRERLRAFAQAEGKLDKEVPEILV